MESDVPNDAPLPPEEVQLYRYVKSFIRNLSNLSAAESADEIKEVNRFHSVLCIGRNSDRLQRLTFLFGFAITKARLELVHVVTTRVDYRPSMINDKKRMQRIISNVKYLDLLKVIFHVNSLELARYLLSLNQTPTQLVPGAIIIDDLTNYIGKNSEESSPANDEINPLPPRKRFRPDRLPHQKMLLSLHKLIGLLIHTANFCGTKIQPPPKTDGSRESKTCLFIATLNLDYFFSTLFGENMPDEQEQELIINEIVERSFQFKIDVDNIVVVEK